MSNKVILFMEYKLPKIPSLPWNASLVKKENKKEDMCHGAKTGHVEGV